MTKPTEMMIRAYAAELVVQIEKAQVRAENGSGFERGQKLGLYEALSVLLNRARSFEIPFSYLGLEENNPDKFI